MRLLMTTLMLCVLTLSTGAWAFERDAVDKNNSLPALDDIGRCTEEPMSLSVFVLESMASQVLEPESLTSHQGAVETNTNAPRKRGNSQVCRRAGDPGCQVQPSPTTPTKLQFEHARVAYLPLYTWLPRRHTTETTLQFSPHIEAGPSNGVHQDCWRPPRATSLLYC